MSAPTLGLSDARRGAKRLSRRRPYLRALGVDYRGRYGYTARHVRCDRCHRDYLPQHVHHWRWRWECGNCLLEQGHGYPCGQSRAESRYRYADEPKMLAALGLTAVPGEEFLPSSYRRVGNSGISGHP